MHRWIGIVGLFIAPTTIITSVCVYFGLVYTSKFYSYFGIESNAIGFTTSDHVTASISVLYAPILVLLLAWVALLWAGGYARRLVQAERRTSLIRRLAGRRSSSGHWVCCAGSLVCCVPSWRSSAARC